MSGQCISSPDRLASQLKQIFCRQLECAGDELGGTEGKGTLRVHAARKQLKKARATLRLLRFALGEKIFRQENIRVRDAARPLSGPRDAEVLLSTFDTLQSRLKEAGVSADFRSIRRLLGTHCRSIAVPSSVPDESVEAIREALLAVHRRSKRWKLRADNWQIVSQGLEKTYQRGRAQFALALEAPTTEHLHDWRKQAKYLWHQLQMLTPVAEGALGELSDQFHRLSDYLGDDHDLAVLEEVMRSLQVDLAAPEHAPLCDCISRRRAQLREKAFALGKRLYNADIKRFRNNMDEHWNDYHNSRSAGPKVATQSG